MGLTPVYGARGEKPLQNADFAMKQTNICRLSGDINIDCDQSNYSSRIVFSHIPIEFGQTGISAIRSAVLENPTVEPNEVDRTTPHGDKAI